MRRSVIFALASMAAFAPSVQSASLGGDGPVRVVVHPQVKGDHVPRSTLTAIFLKEAPAWSDGRPIVPVDQSVKSEVRSVFSNRLLGQSVMNIQIYWQRKMSSGVTPPPVKTSDADVLAFVATTPGAIGYVSSTTVIPDNVKTIQIGN